MLDKIADALAAQCEPWAIDELKAERSYEQYQNDPVGFCEQELAETVMPDVIAMLESVRDNKGGVNTIETGTQATDWSRLTRGLSRPMLIRLASRAA